MMIYYLFCLVNALRDWNFQLKYAARFIIIIIKNTKSAW